jgi:galactose oxidase-like protein/glyoxal oxidase-like protein/fibronectin type III domain protein
MRTTHFFFSRIVQIVVLVSCLMILICGSLLTATESAGVTTSDANNTAVVSAPNPQSSPEVFGQWSSPITLPIVAIHMHLLPNGKVLLWQDDNHPNYPPTRQGSQTLARVWDVDSGVITDVNVTNRNLFCSGHAFLPDGRLFIAGGHDTGDGDGINDAHIFNSTNNTWTLQSQQMFQGRWYPSAVTVGNGEIVVVSGQDTNGTNSTPDVWETNSGGGWRRLTNATITLFNYPYMHLAPNGNVFISGPERTTRYLDPASSGALGQTFDRFVNKDRDYGSSVMYDVGKVAIFGGGGGKDPTPQDPNPPPPEDTAEVINLNDASPVWRLTSGNLAARRRQMNATLLPNGKVLITGGSSATGFSNASGALLTAELWNPVSETFTTMASAQNARLYHSTAILLPDGRVVSAGSGRPGTEQKNAEIYSPPYLFTTGGGAATRPTIDSHLSNGVRPGQSIFVTTPDAASISDVTLIALSSVTHARNMSQRFNRLSFTQAMGGVNVALPSSANACPPGYYMLFILNSSGVPSVAKIISVNSSNALPPGAPSNLVATASSTSSVSLSWSAGSGSIDHYEIQRSASVNGPFTTLPSTTSTSFTDSSLSSTTTYIYRVRAVDAQGNYSSFSNIDIATTIIFTDDPLTVGVTIIQAQHVNELRQAVNAVRAAAGLSAATWTDSSLSGVVVKAVHISELRSKVDEARTSLGLSTSSYTDPSLTPTSTVVKAVHVHELRDRVK